jgi:hypothetical protein
MLFRLFRLFVEKGVKRLEQPEEKLIVILLMTP